MGSVTNFNEFKISERKPGKKVSSVCIRCVYTWSLDYFLCSLVILFNVSLKLSTLVIRFSSNTSLCDKITRCTPSATPARIDLISPEFLISSNSAYSSIGTSIVTFLLSLVITISSLISTLSIVILLNSFFVFMLLYILVLIYSLSSYTLLLKRVTFICSEGTNHHYRKILELIGGPVLW